MGPLIPSVAVVVVVVVVKEGGVLTAYHPVTSCYDGWPLLGRSCVHTHERERERSAEGCVGRKEGAMLCACCSAVLMLCCALPVLVPLAGQFTNLQLELEVQAL